MSLVKQKIKQLSENPDIFPVAGLLLGLFVWLIDAIIDVFILDEDQDLLINIFMPDESTELWMRTLVVLVFVIMGFYSRHALLKQIKLHNLLLDTQKELEIQANTDPLTALYNRRKFISILDHELDRFQRYHKPFCIVTIDIDYFKKINDNFGHETGDSVLTQFSSILQSNIRQTDSACRWGGEEFILLLIESNCSQTVQSIEALQTEFNKIIFDEAGNITASYGITQVRKEDSPDDIIRRSDYAMYKAKKNGRNRIEVL